MKESVCQSQWSITSLYHPYDPFELFFHFAKKSSKQIKYRILPVQYLYTQFRCRCMLKIYFEFIDTYIEYINTVILCILFCKKFPDSLFIFFSLASKHKMYKNRWYVQKKMVRTRSCLIIGKYTIIHILCNKWNLPEFANFNDNNFVCVNVT